jgi:surface antigen
MPGGRASEASTPSRPALRKARTTATIIPSLPIRLAALSVATLCAFAFNFATIAHADDASQLCAGYSGCSTQPLTTHGYKDAASTSWWSMYPGINCTNYAAYVESQVFGVSRPAVLLGDADQWGARAAQAGIPVDATPTAGSVAVWGADAQGMGGYGHVAVVESVAPDGSYIDISQSGMGTTDDGYDWERLYRSGGSWEPWPSSFIHFSGPRIPGTLPQLGLRRAGAEPVVAGG